MSDMSWSLCTSFGFGAVFALKAMTTKMQAQRSSEYAKQSSLHPFKDLKHQHLLSTRVDGIQQLERGALECYQIIDLLFAHAIASLWFKSYLWVASASLCRASSVVKFVIGSHLQQKTWKLTTASKNFPRPSLIP